MPNIQDPSFMAAVASNPMLRQKLFEPQPMQLEAQPGLSSTPDAMSVPPSPAPALSAQPSKPPVPLATIKPDYQTAQKRFGELTAPSPTDTTLTHTKLNTGVPGVQQIHNKPGRILGTIADTIGTILAPRISAQIPGTTMHHQMLANQASGVLGEQRKEFEAQNKGNLEAAQATNQASMPEFHDAQNEIKQLTAENKATADAANVAERGAYHEGQNAARQTAADASLRKAGYRQGETGEIEAIPYEEMSPGEQANYDLHSAQTEMAHATAQLRLAQANGDTGQQELQRQRIALIGQRLNLMQHTSDRLDRQFEFRSQGTVGGVPQEGTMLSERGVPVGTANAANVRPTGTERTRADLAFSGVEQLSDMRSIVQKHPELFGPGAGRATAFQNWIGSEDPEAKRFLTARNTLADHATGVFGGRSEGAISANRIASGDLKDNPAAILAALGQMEKAMKQIQSRGIVRSVGGNAPPSNGGGETTKEQYDALPVGATYTKGGHKFVKQ